MKTIVFLALGFLAGGAARGLAAQFVSYDFPVGKNLGDANPVGLLDSRNLVLDPSSILDVNVRLNIAGRDAGAWNGDLYAYLTHDSGFSLLLNRPGRRSGSGTESFGYGDNGLAIILDDEAANGDVHRYRATLFGSEATGLGGSPLSGSWAPDGRDVDPDDALSEVARSALLDGFDGLDPNGSWHLFVADLNLAGTARLDSWGLDFTLLPGGSVPDVDRTLLLLAAGFPLVAWVNRRVRRRSPRC